MRNRIVKEGFFRSYELSRLSPLARILFEGLWCLADKNGRLWDRPQQIKAEVLPYDDADIDKLLSDLRGSGFILRYEVSGRGCIQVINFEKHQPLTSWEKTTSAEVPPMKNFRRTSLGLQDEKEPRARAGVSTVQNSTEQIRSEEEALRAESPPFTGSKFREALKGYEQHRKEKRTPLTATARKALYKNLAAWGESRATAALIYSTVQGYTGCFEEKANGNDRETASERNVRNIKDSLDYLNELSDNDRKVDPEVETRLLTPGTGPGRTRRPG